MFSALRRLFSADPTLDPQTFVLWEPCTKSHGEIVPGYASYLLALGYKVLVLVTPARLSEGLFSRFTHPRLVLARLSQRRIRHLMRSPAIANAAGVMISTAGKLTETPAGAVDLDAVFGGSQRPRRLLLVEHDVRRRVDAGQWDPRFITLRQITRPAVASVVVNPHDFGAVALHDKTPGKTIFVMVGAARAKRRNQNIVYQALSYLIAAGRTDFELRLIGKPGKDIIPAQIRPYVTLVGRVDFSQLYAEVEAADFLLTAFQGDNPDHAPYRETKTTGSFQLGYGFATPCILQRDFATGTALHKGNSLFYDRDDEMGQAMLTACRMSPAEYATMRDAMVRDAAKLAAQSLADLKTLTDG